MVSSLCIISLPRVKARALQGLGGRRPERDEVDVRQTWPLIGCSTDFIDIVKDPVPPNEYKTEEDPKLFQSTKTHRGPLSDNWIEEYKRRLLPVMCAYKLCKVEFRYWGMQSKIERFIHDTGEHTRKCGHELTGLPACLPLCSMCLPAIVCFLKGDPKARVQLHLACLSHP